MLKNHKIIFSDPVLIDLMKTDTTQTELRIIQIDPIWNIRAIKEGEYLMLIFSEKREMCAEIHYYYDGSVFTFIEEPMSWSKTVSQVTEHVMNKSSALAEWLLWNKLC